MTLSENQSAYWDSVAAAKTFTHPLDTGLLKKYLRADSSIMDYGCGYGRTVKQLMDAGYRNVAGFDTSEKMVARGTKTDALPIHFLKTLSDLPIEDNALDGALLFAVLTCIPANAAQEALIETVHAKLKPGGILYISDYYLQGPSRENIRYTYLNGDPKNFGVFSLPEGAMCRHHTKEWIAGLLQAFSIREEKQVGVFTMNGHAASAFQLIAQKQKPLPNKGKGQHTN